MTHPPETNQRSTPRSIRPLLNSALWIVVVAITVLQMTIGNVLKPQRMGKSLNLSPLVVILSLTFWGALWGIPGMLLCVPFTVISMIVFAQFPSTRKVAVLLSKKTARSRVPTENSELLCCGVQCCFSRCS